MAKNEYDFSGGRAREIRGEWRCIKSTVRGEKLPGRRGTLSITIGQGGFSVFFETSGSQSWSTQTELKYDTMTGEITVGRYPEEQTVYAPAATTRRKKLPIPERPDLQTFASSAWTDGKRDHSKSQAHKVRAVETWPNPNRDFNENDALVEAMCGWTQWVGPDGMNPKSSMAKCPTCFPKRPRAT